MGHSLEADKGQDMKTYKNGVIGRTLTDDERYAAAALRLINAWPAGLQSTDRRDDSTLCFSYHFPALILAADLLRACPAWTAPARQAWDRFLRETALPIHCLSPIHI